MTTSLCSTKMTWNILSQRLQLQTPTELKDSISIWIVNLDCSNREVPQGGGMINVMISENIFMKEKQLDDDKLKTN